IRKVKWHILLLVSAGCIALAFPVHYIVTVLQEYSNAEDVSFLEYYKDSTYPLLTTLFFVGIIPGVFEELSFRGNLYACLHELSGTKAAIITSAFLFGLIHFTILSLPWLVGIGLFFAWLRHKYQTVWYGMAGHFLYNSTLVLFEYW